jgi:hypothetical protein
MTTVVTDDQRARRDRTSARHAGLYDDLPDHAQDVIRAEWDRRVAATLAELDFAETLRRLGKPWAEADEAGNLVMRDPGPPLP